MRRLLLSVLLTGCTAVSVAPPATSPSHALAAPDQSWPTTAIRATEYAGMERKSFYVPMRDGVRLAVDVWLPTGLAPGTRLPALLEQTRYYRSALIKSDPNGACRPPMKPTINLFVTHGYAYVLLDTRGSGASFGTRSAEYSDAEIKDGAQIVDWIVSQNWSDGKVGALGQSYTGTTAEMLLRNHHPAVKAVMPTFSGYDFYSEILFPGGIRSTFAKYWSDLISELDHAKTPDASPILGPCPVDGDADRSQLQAAIAQHAGNFNVEAATRHVAFSDDTSFPRPPDADVPLYAITGFYDSGYTLGALRRFAASTSPQKRLLIGPWNHGARYFYAPGVRAPTPSSFDLAAEKLRYFDYELKGIDEGFTASPPIRYFTTGANRWQAAAQWPPQQITTQTWYFDAGNALATDAPNADGKDEYSGDGTADSGVGNRWRATMGPLPAFYPDRASVDRQLLTYTSAPLATDLEVTGNPIAHVFLATADADADVIVYLEEVTAAGEVNYITEGELRASHRKSHLRADAQSIVADEPMQIDIELLPLSHEFRKGSRVRVTFLDADRAQFVESPPHRSDWNVLRTRNMPSRIDLPAKARSLGP